MPATMDDVQGITVAPMQPDERGRDRYQWSATLGDGTRKGLAFSEEDAFARARRAKRWLLHMESHDPDVLDQMADLAADVPETYAVGKVTLISAWGGVIEVNEADVQQALANDCRLPGDDEPQSVHPHLVSESPAEQARRQPGAKARKPKTTELDQTNELA